MKIQFLVFSILLVTKISYAEKSNKENEKEPSVHQQEKHDDHDEEEKHEGHDESEHGKSDSHDDHKDEKGESHEGHGDEHGEENPQVGPNKGILSANPAEGVQLSPEAEKNFEIQKMKVSNPNNFEIPKTAIVTAGLEVNLYRYRGGFYKRIDFETLNRSGNKISIRSKELKEGDEIAITGLGFLRIVEIAAFDGAPEGHSH